LLFYFFFIIILINKTIIKKHRKAIEKKNKLSLKATNQKTKRHRKAHTDVSTSRDIKSKEMQ
jgi:hypothetical protein